MKTSTVKILSLGALLSLAPLAACECGAVSAPAGDAGADASGVNIDGGSVDGAGIDAAGIDAGAENDAAVSADATVEDGNLAADAAVEDAMVAADAAVEDAVFSGDAATTSDASMGADAATAPTNHAPVVVITAPADNSNYSRGESITFTCVATDIEDGTVANGSIAWSSDLEIGWNGIGATTVTGFNTEGTHTVTCTATDSGGLSSSASITVNVAANFAPVPVITAPADNAFFGTADSVSFSGNATDAEDGTVPGSRLEWLDGTTSLGFGLTVTQTLTLGDHVITLRATDSAGATGEAQITVHIVANVPPQCSIAQPADGADIVEGGTVTFDASCVDLDGSGTIPNNDYSWSSDVESYSLGTGNPVQNALVTLGAQVITVCATDTTDASLQGCATISVNVIANQAPVVTINRPRDSAQIRACQVVQLGCSGVDPEGGTVTYEWSSNQEGSLSTSGNFAWTPALSGAHVLTCTATDAQGKAGSASVSVTIESPVAGIRHPADGQMYAPSAQVPFSGAACDTEDGQLQNTSLVWTSSLDGEIGTGTSFSINTLSRGNHTITLTATDSDGNTGTDTIALSINTAPTVSITAPGNDSSWLNSDTVTFTATANDTQDGNIAANITWSNSTLGQFGTGGTFDFANLPLGKQLITASVTDSLGATSTDTITITVTDGASLFRNLTGLGSRVNDVIAGTGGRYWIATNGDGVYSWNGTGMGGGALVQYTTNNSDLSDNQVLSLLVLADGTLIIGTDGNGIEVCAPPGGATSGTPNNCVNYNDGGLFGALPDKPITALLELPDGRVLIGTERCMTFWDVANDQANNICSGDGGGDGLVNSGIHDLAYDATRGGVWIATGGGVSLMTPSASGVVVANQSFTTTNTDSGLPSNNVRAVAVAPSGQVWFATNAGVAVLDGSGALTTYNTGSGLPSNNIRDIAIDTVLINSVSHEVVWAATNAGLVRGDQDLSTVLTITTADGLASNDCRSLWIDAGSHYKYVGTAAGLSVYRGL